MHVHHSYTCTNTLTYMKLASRMRLRMLAIIRTEQVKIRHRDATNTSSACVALHEKDAIPTVDLSITSCCRGALYLFAQWRRRNMQIFGEDDALAMDTAGGGGTRKANGADEDGAQRRGLVTPLVKPSRSDSNSSFLGFSGSKAPAFIHAQKKPALRIQVSLAKENREVPGNDLK